MNENEFIFQIWQPQNSHDVYALSDEFVPQTPSYDKQQTAIKPSQEPMKHIETLFTLVPDIVLASNDLNPKQINPCLAVLLFADISGFTALSQKCANTGDNGVYLLTTILNDFLGRMVGSIYEHGGDVFKFGGDSFIALWKVEMSDSFGHVIHRALRCALDIQKTHGNFKTAIKTVLRVKVALSAGNVVWCTVGSPESRRCIIAGEPVIEIKHAERFCRSGDVVVTQSLWGHVSRWDFQHQLLEDGKFIKIIRVIGYFGLSSEKLMKRVGAPVVEPHSKVRSEKKEVRCFDQFDHKERACADLRVCIMAPVVQQIDADLSLEYLTEMRVLTVMFINIVPFHMFTTKLINVVDKAFNIVQSLVKNAGGFVDKVCLFDKDVSFLTVFGLRDMFQEDRLGSCLSCGYDIRESCHTLNGVKQVSIGIATGLSYCGVVGHVRRREFTVIGPAINKASRIMIAYPGQITCDTATNRAARMAPGSFVTAPYRPMHGLVDDEEFYHFIADRKRTLQLALQGGMAPLLGRKAEIDVWRRIVSETQKSFDLSGLIIIGSEGVGKSRLMDGMVAEARRFDVSPLVVGLRRGHSLVPFGGALHILAEAMGLVTPNPQHVIHTICELFSDKLTAEEAAHLADVMLDDNKIELERCVTVTDHLKNIFIMVLKKLVGPTILAIDDVDYCDDASWELLMAAVEARSVVMLLTGEPQRQQPLITNYLSRHLHVMQLQPLALRWIPPLACQLFKCDAIETSVAEFLMARTEGKPGLCHMYLRALVDNRHINVKDVRSSGPLRIEIPADHLVQFLVVPDVTQDTEKPPRVHSLPPDKFVMDDKDFAYGELTSLIELLNAQNWCQRMVDRKEYLPLKNRIADSSPSINSCSTKKNCANLKNVPRWLLTNNTARRGFSSIKFPQNVSLMSSLIDESVEIFKNEISLVNSDIFDMIMFNDLGILRKYYPTASELPRRNSTLPGRLDRPSIDNEMLDDTMLRLHVHRSSSIVSIADSVLPSSHRRRCSMLAIVREPSKSLDQAVSPDSYMGLMSIFERLRPYEQLLLKCSSVIGVKFYRVMLNDVLHNPDPSYISSAIKRLFEMKVFACAELLANESTHEMCGCVVPGKAATISPHSTCLHLRFRKSTFRDALYDLLPLNQKKMFHARAVAFLKCQPRQCTACLRQSSLAEHAKHFDKKCCGGKSLSVESENIVFHRTKHLLKKFKNSPLINLDTCTCAVVERALLTSLIEHCKAADMFDDALRHTVRLVRVLLGLELYCDAQAQIDLVMTEIKRDDVIFDAAPILAELACLQGELNFISGGDKISAMRHLLRALAIIEPSFSMDRFRPSLFIRIWMRLLRRKASPLVARVLNTITCILMIENKFKEAHFACMEALAVANEVQLPTERCRAYANLVDISLSLRNSLTDLVDHFEGMLKLAEVLVNFRSVDEAVALSQILHAIYDIKLLGDGNMLLGGELMEALTRVGQCLPMPRGQEIVTLEKVHLMMFTGSVRSAVTNLLMLRSGTSNQQFWFHSLNLDFIRATGHWVARPRESQDFLFYAMAHTVGPAYHRGNIALVLWLLYTDPERSLKWQSRDLVPGTPAVARCLTDVCTRTDQLQTLVLQSCTFPAGATWGAKLNRSLGVWMNDMAALTVTYHIFFPMYYHVLGYVAFKVEKNVLRGNSYLNDAQVVAQQQGNYLYVARVALAQESWRVGAMTGLFHLWASDKLPEWTKWRRSDWNDKILSIPG